MTILHITNDYSGSTVYQNFVKELDGLNISQIVYNPIRDKNRIGKNIVEFTQQDSQILYRHILTKYTDRIFYRKKINKIVKDIERTVDLSKINFIHAHTWYSDGGVAYELYKKYRIPYIVAVRATDLKIFNRYFRYLDWYSNEILLKAQNIIVISKAYVDKLVTTKSIQSVKEEILPKMLIIPNGVDQFWIDNYKHKKTTNKKNNFLYVGNFIKRKNLLQIINAVEIINSKSSNKVTLTIIGKGSGEYYQKVLQAIDNKNDIYNLVGYIDDKQQLIKHYQSCDFFIMPSISETFGLVYIEALLQGLPVLYTQEEGIDGYYDENIGEKVLKPTPVEIADKMEKLIQNFSNYEIPVQKMLHNHDWKLIALKYQKLYTI